MLSWMHSFTSRMPAPLLGVDITPPYMCLVELGKDPQGTWILERCACEPVDPAWVTDGQIEAPQALAQALQRLISKSGSRTKRVALALPTSSVTSKRVVMPKHLSVQELEYQVQADASQFLAFPLDEVSLDFCVLGAHGDSEVDVQVLWVATRKNKVLAHCELAASAGLTPSVMDVAAYACALAASRWIASLPNGAKDECIALVQLLAHGFCLQVIRNEEVIYYTDQAQVTSMTDSGALSEFGFSALVSTHPSAHGAALSASVSHSSFAQHIQHALQRFFSSTSFLQVDRLALFGAAPLWQPIVAALQQQMKLEVNVLNPFEGMRLCPGIEASVPRHAFPQYLTACGLAMRRYMC